MLLLLYKSKLKKYHAPTEIDSALNIDCISNEENYNMASSILNLSTPTIISTPNDDSNVKKKLENPNEQMFVDRLEKIHLNRLKNSLDLIVTQAEKYYYDCDYQKCNLLTEKVLKKDPYHTSCLPIHISCQVELKQSNSMFFFK